MAKIPVQKITYQAQDRKVQREKAFEEKESDRWVEALKAVEQQLQQMEELLPASSEPIKC